ncbi:hypothetical protein H9P43_007026 [Blastocladiella emersonii ATCC 22665]|nr:hypothetical protein H9P43_007026 [Blastocladiella emersonii ATCC 22665]
MDPAFNLDALMQLCDAVDASCALAEFEHPEHAQLVAATALKLPSTPPQQRPASAITDPPPAPKKPTNTPRPLAVPPIPRARLASSGDPDTAVRWVQRQLDALGYNHLPGPIFFPINKRASGRSLAAVAKRILAAGLPIKCLEAVVAAMWLLSAAEARRLDWLPVAFKTRIAGLPGVEEGGHEQVYRHIVLAVVAPPSPAGGTEERWGAVGLSRRRELMDKPLGFAYLSLKLPPPPPPPPDLSTTKPTHPPPCPLGPINRQAITLMWRELRRRGLPPIALGHGGGGSVDLGSAQDLGTPLPVVATARRRSRPAAAEGTMPKLAAVPSSAAGKRPRTGLVKATSGSAKAAEGAAEGGGGTGSRRGLNLGV